MRAYGDWVGELDASTARRPERVVVGIAPSMATIGLALLLGCRADDAPRDARSANADVRIVYDRFRIPHVFAEDDRAAFFGLGYQQARDFPVATLANLWSATGRFAHVAGKTVLARDERIRQFGIDERAATQMNDERALDPEVRGLLEAFADGVNAGRRRWLYEDGTFDALVGIDPDGGAEPALWFDPVPPWLDPELVQDDRIARLRRLFEAEITLLHVLALGVATNGGPEFMGAGYTSRTNIWTVRNGEGDPSTVTMVDSHQPIKHTGARAYFVQVSGASYDVMGYSYPGFPCVTLGFNDDIAFSHQTLPSVPSRVQSGGESPLRIRGTAPVHSATWVAKLAPGAPARIRVGEETVALRSIETTLQYWDVERRGLVDDPRGSRHFHRVPETNVELAPYALEYPVVVPGPDAALDETTDSIRFEGRSFLAARSPWEFWIGLGRTRRLSDDRGQSGSGADSLGALLKESVLCMGRGQALVVSAANGALEYLLMGLVPIPGSGTGNAAVLDGNDPTQRWRGFHAYDELPRIVDRAGHGKRPEIWVQSNGSPHFLRPAPFDDSKFAGREYVLEREPWKTWRQDRARELLERAAADGHVSLDEIAACARDVQDVWSRRMWPLVEATGQLTGVSVEARDWLAWVDRLRFEDPGGGRGSEEFLAHPMSQVTVFMTLLRDAFERRVIDLTERTSNESALAFDAMFELPTAHAFGSDAPWARTRAALVEAVEQVARLYAASLAGSSGRLVNRDVLAGLLGARADGTDERSPWARLFDAPTEDWADAPVVARWGLTNLYALTPHARKVPRDRTLDRSLLSIFAPERITRSPYYSRQESVVFPIGGVRDSIFQVHANAYRWNQDALHTVDDGALYVLPLAFGSQILYAVEHRPGEKPRARFQAALGSTEITTAIPLAGVAAGDHVRNLADFVAGRWNELSMDEERLAENAIFTVRLRWP